MHHDLEALPRWRFAFPGRIRDELTALAPVPDRGARYGAFRTRIWSRMPREPRWLLDQLAVELAAHGRGIGETPDRGPHIWFLRRDPGTGR
jgi:hypothetical protein